MRKRQQGKDMIKTTRRTGRRLLTHSRRGATLLLAGTLAASVGTANADTYRTSSPSSSYYVAAPVVNVSPITSERTVQHPIRQCTQQSYREDRYERRHREENLFLPGLFGGIVGGLIGNQFGGGSGKKILTVVGALAGSSIANDIAHNQRQQNRYAQPVRRDCYTTYERELVEQIDGYHVVYEYAGQHFSKQMDELPGSTVAVRVQLQPAAQI